MGKTLPVQLGSEADERRAKAQAGMAKLRARREAKGIREKSIALAEERWALLDEIKAAHGLRSRSDALDFLLDTSVERLGRAAFVAGRQNRSAKPKRRPTPTVTAFGDLFSNQERAVTG